MKSTKWIHQTRRVKVCIVVLVLIFISIQLQLARMLHHACQSYEAAISAAAADRAAAAAADHVAAAAAAAAATAGRTEDRPVTCFPVENAPFPYGITAAATATTGAESCHAPHHASTDASRGGGFTACALCNQTDWARYLAQLANILRNRFQQECSELVVYSVAFGAKHEAFLDGPNWHKDSLELLSRHGRCFFAFVQGGNALSVNQYQQYHPEDSDDIDDSDDHFYLSPSYIFQRKGIEGLFHLIPVPPHLFPYQNGRRNTKLFKLYGGLMLFDFAKQIVWQDAKLQKLQWARYPGVRNYTRLAQTTQRAKAPCVSLQSLPLHESALGPQRLPLLQSHCEVLLSPSISLTRTVSDSMLAIQRQCNTYPWQHKRRQQQRQQQFPSFPTLSLDDGLIDSALISWNNNSPKCQRFNLELSCRWLSEIHCQGDRDQISFPEVISQMGLVQQPGRPAIQPSETEFLDKLLGELVESERQQGSRQGERSGNLAPVWEPRIHFRRSICHWYHTEKGGSDCPSNIPGSSTTTSTSRMSRHRHHEQPQQLRIAIVVVGTVQRYSLNATLQNLIRPLVLGQGHQVDTFLSLTTRSAPPYRSEKPYMSRMTWDPMLLWGAKKPAAEDEEKQSSKNQESVLASRLERFIQYQMSLAGAVPRRVHVHETSPTRWEDDPKVQELLFRQQQRQKPDAAERSPLQKNDSSYHHYLQVPIRDSRRGAQTRTDRANRNILTVFYSLQKLWEELVETESNLGVPYDYVLFLRDDALFLTEWNLNKLLQQAYKNNNNGGQKGEVDAFFLSCDANAMRMHPLEINDHGGLYPRRTAGIYGDYWKSLVGSSLKDNGGNLEQCASRLEDSFREERGCNSEMLLRWILQYQHNLTNIQLVGQALLPFQRSVHVQMSSNYSNPGGNYIDYGGSTGVVRACFHKYCQSQQDRLLTNGTLKECKDLAFSQVMVKDWDGHLRTYEVNLIDTIGHVKRQVANAYGIHRMAVVKLSFQGHPLINDKKTLNGCGVMNMDTLELIPIQMTVEVQNGKSIPLTLKPTKSVKALKNKVFGMANIPVEDQWIQFNGTRFNDDDLTLEQLGINNGDKVTIVVENNSTGSKA